jgi:hypothetical protein
VKKQSFAFATRLRIRDASQRVGIPSMCSFALSRVVEIQQKCRLPSESYVGMAMNLGTVDHPAAWIGTTRNARANADGSLDGRFWSDSTCKYCQSLDERMGTQRFEQIASLWRGSASRRRPALFTVLKAADADVTVFGRSRGRHPPKNAVLHPWGRSPAHPTQLDPVIVPRGGATTVGRNCGGQHKKGPAEVCYWTFSQSSRDVFGATYPELNRTSRWEDGR